jgi:hypothetical protein
MSRPIRLGNIALSFHAVSAAVVQGIFRDSWGHSVDSSAAPHEETFRRYGAGAGDRGVGRSWKGQVAPMKQPYYSSICL